MSYTFKKGVHPVGNKQLSRNCAIEVAPAPQRVFIPLSQHIGKPAVPVIEAGAHVCKGELIAKADVGLSVNVFSSVSGTFKGVVNRINIFGVKTAHMEIENDFKEEEVFLPEMGEITRESLAARIAAAGIVGMGGATFPSSFKLSSKVPIDTLVINGAECEPYITCDNRIMLEYTQQFLEGVKLLKAACGASKIYIGVETNKLDAILRLNEFEEVSVTGLRQCKSKPNAQITVVALTPKYPQGAEKQLIYACTRRKVPEGELPSSVGACVFNVHTAFAVYRAAYENRPLYERVTTLSGGAVKAPKNAWVKNGTPYSGLAAFCGAENYVKVLSGGPMMGFSVYGLDAVTAKGTGSILFLTEEEAKSYEPMTCIGCGRCVQACPMNLMPAFIDEYALMGEFAEAKKFGATSCIECGSCSFVCPSKRPIIQGVRLAKKMIREKKL